MSEDLPVEDEPFAPAHPSRALMAQRSAPDETVVEPEQSTVEKIQAVLAATPLMPAAIGGGVLLLIILGFFIFSGSRDETEIVTAQTSAAALPADERDIVSHDEMSVSKQGSDEMTHSAALDEVPTPEQTAGDNALTEETAPIEEIESIVRAEIVPVNDAAVVASLDAQAQEPIDETGDDALPETVSSQYADGERFRDCTRCPEMTVIPAGSYRMGARERETGRDPSETPQVFVSLVKPFAISVTEVTFDDWQACLNDGGCAGYTPPSLEWGEGSRPVIYVSFDDAQRYADWLFEKTGQSYRLPSEAEWEYAARAGSAAPFSFGDAVTGARANFNAGEPYNGEAAPYLAKTIAVRSFAANRFGLYDMHGNVWEWVADCWSQYRQYAAGTPTGGRCDTRVLKGGGWNSKGSELRSGHRRASPESNRTSEVGFRLVRDL